VGEFLAMGGYAAYVWSAFGLTGLVLGGLVWQSLWQVRRREAALARLREQLRGERPGRGRPLRPRRESAPEPGLGEPA
jgi:heme exporter protein D